MESDPVIKAGDSLSWDDWSAWECPVLKNSGYYEMYYNYNTFGAGLGMATADIDVGTNDKRFTKANLRVTIYPNPVY
jgi:hypothetical protein